MKRKIVFIALAICIFSMGTLEVFGGSVDATSEFNTLNSDIDAIHTDLTALNTRIENAATLYEDEFVEIATETLVRNVANKIIDRDFTGALNLIKTELVSLGAQGSAAATEIEGIKSDILAIKTAAEQAANGAQSSVTYFTDEQMAVIKNKVTTIFNEYTTFTKHMISSFIEPHYTDIINRINSYDVETAIDKADSLIDEVLSYETRIRNKITEIKNNPPRYIQALTFVGEDLEDEIIEDIENSFESGLNTIKNRVTTEIDNYINNLQTRLDTSINTIVAGSATRPTKQLNITHDIQSCLTIKIKIEALKNKILTNINNTRVSSELTTFTNTINDMYDNRILASIEQNLTLEDTLFIYKPATRLIVAQNFIVPDQIKTLTGLPESNIVLTGITNGKIKTTATIKAMLNETAFEIYTFVVKADVSGDGRRNVSDIILTIDQALSLNALATPNFAAADMNEDARINISDVVEVIDSVLGL